jgi:hydrogenase maturation protease
VLIIGLGNEVRGDDAAGLAAARQLKREFAERVEVLESGGDGAQLMQAWKDARSVIVVDAAASGTPPGTVHRFDACDEALPAGRFGGSTHAFGLSEAIELARALGELPQRLVIYAIEGKGFETGAALSPEVQAAIESLAARVRADIGSMEAKSNCEAPHA